MSSNNRLIYLYLNLLYVPIYDVTSSSILSYKRFQSLWRNKLRPKPHSASESQHQ